MFEAFFSYKTPEWREYARAPTFNLQSEVTQLLMRYQHLIPEDIGENRQAVSLSRIFDELQKDSAARKTMDEILARRDVHIAKYEDKILKSVHNGRLLTNTSLFTNGFVLRRSSVDFAEWDDPKSVRERYYNAAVQLVRKEVGATRAWCGEHIVRSSAALQVKWSKLFAVATSPLAAVHNDFVEAYDETFRRSYRGDDGANVNQFGVFDHMRRDGVTLEELENSRILVVNVWRNIADEPVKRFPLALCDRRTVTQDELQECAIGRDDKNAGLSVYTSEARDKHEFYVFPEMTSREVVLFLTYDSEAKPFSPTLHCAVDDPRCKEGIRRSCEARVVCLLPKFPQRANM